jgi:serine/threonine protein kinase
MMQWQGYDLPDRNLFPGQYSVQEVLAQTNISTVLLGVDEPEGCKVIIKCFKQQAKGAYLREISAVFDLKHPHLVRCLNTFQRADGESCLVYEYQSGGNLAGYLEANGALSVDLTLQCLQDILKALIYLHSHNRIHCDIKPDNIFLRPRPDGQFDFVLGDLGAACFIREAREGRYVIGTPSYIAPERIHNQFFFNSDLYSLGIVAYELATGFRPFTGSVEEITEANLAEIPSLEVVGYSPLRDLLDQLLTKLPQKRLATASIAYFHAYKLQLELNAQLPPKKSPEQDQGKPGDVVAPPKAEQQFHLDLNDKPGVMYCFKVSGRVLIGLDYATHTEIIDPECLNGTVKTVLNSLPIQVTGLTTFAYATPTRIQLNDLVSNECTTLAEKLDNIKCFDVNGKHVLFADDFTVVGQGLTNQPDFSYRSSVYLSGSTVILLEDGGFCMCEGMAKDTVTKRDNAGSVVFEWALDGTLVEMTRSGSGILAVTQNPQAPGGHTVWYLHVSEISRKYQPTMQIKQISCMGNAVYWLSQEAGLYRLGEELEPKLVAQFSKNAAQFAVSYDGSVIVVVDAMERYQAAVTILNIRE